MAILSPSHNTASHGGTTAVGGFAPWSLVVPDRAKAQVSDNPVRPERLNEETRFAIRMRESNAQASAAKPDATGKTEAALAKETDGESNDGSQFGPDGFGFDDFLDIINPLQHIPLVNTAYRALTGDEIEPGSRLVGGAIFGGPIGFAGALANNIVEDQSGRDIGEHVLAFFTGDEDSPDAEGASSTLAQGPQGTQGLGQAPAQVATPLEIGTVATSPLDPPFATPRNGAGFETAQGFAASADSLAPASSARQTRLTDVFFDEDDPTTPFSRAAQQQSAATTTLSDETIFTAPPTEATRQGPAQPQTQAQAQAQAQSQTVGRRRVSPETAAQLNALANAEPEVSPQNTVLAATGRPQNQQDALANQQDAPSAIAQTQDDNPFRRFERQSGASNRIDVAESPLARQAIQIAAQNSAIQQAQALSQAGAARAYRGGVNPASQLPASARQQIPDSFDMSALSAASPAAAGAELRLQMAGLTAGGPLAAAQAAMQTQAQTTAQATAQATTQTTAQAKDAQLAPAVAAGAATRLYAQTQAAQMPAQSVSKEAIPDAMLSALERYNALKANSG